MLVASVVYWIATYVAAARVCADALAASVAMSTLTFEQILRFEDDPAIAEFRCEQTGIPLWTQIRVALHPHDSLRPAAHRAGAEQVDHACFPEQGRPRPSPDRSFETPGCASTNQLRADLCVMAEESRTSGSTAVFSIGSRTHLMAQVPGQSLVIADHFEWRWPFPRQYERVMLHAPIQAANAIRGRLRGRSSSTLGRPPGSVELVQPASGGEHEGRSPARLARRSSSP